MDWETPPDLFSELEQQYGPFDVDVCATHDTAKCPVYFTPTDDGLAQQWWGTCWMNPPYGRAIKHWIQKAYTEAQEGRATTICLIPARTDTAYWHDYITHADEIRFLRGRVRFIRGGETGPAPFPSAVVVFRAKTGVN